MQEKTILEVTPKERICWYWKWKTTTERQFNQLETSAAATVEGAFKETREIAVRMEGDVFQLDPWGFTGTAGGKRVTLKRVDPVPCPYVLTDPTLVHSYKDWESVNKVVEKVLVIYYFSVFSGRVSSPERSWRIFPSLKENESIESQFQSFLKKSNDEKSSTPQRTISFEEAKQGGASGRKIFRIEIGWFYKDSNMWIPFSRSHTWDIEKAYTNKELSITIPEKGHLNLNKMVLTDKQNKYQLKRLGPAVEDRKDKLCIESSEDENLYLIVKNSFPLYWDVDNPSFLETRYQVQQVPQQSKEFQYVSHLLNSTRTDPTFSFDISNILRIQSQLLWVEFLKARLSLLHKHNLNISTTNKPIQRYLKQHPIRTQLLDPRTNEAYLFHGSKAIENIARHGFEASSRADAPLKGGIYFSDCSTLEDKPLHSEDCFANTCTCKPLFMILSRVLLGDAHTDSIPAHSDGKLASSSPPKPSLVSLHTITHSNDSLCYQPDYNNPKLRRFAIFNSAHAYPEYLIQYKRK